eukprot:TRINITY_DN66775_c0_g1_i1.p1 TRINITY_DN66775_c0_g1~~TRINITY_DN66775_c0_g1_i1.p1  ORF type:complete len:360 (-),score=40.08 TRINITY_DN66775_c0_g1_i1:77-1102(-)
MGRNDTRISVNPETDLQLNPPGKLVAPLGTPHIPGNLQRSQSLPNSVFTCPNGWAADTSRSNASRGQEFKARQRGTAISSHAMASGAWGDLSCSLRPGTSAPLGPPGGGHTQGALTTLRPQTTGLAGESLDMSKHGWYHPLGMAETARMADPSEPASWKWHMMKARDHIGYGDHGRVGKGDTQVTAVSGDGPSWLVGTRTLPGPFGTKKFPVRRCPVNRIEGDVMKVRGKTYEQGHGLSTVHTLHDDSRPPTAVKELPPELPAKTLQERNKAQYCNLIEGGCQTRGIFINNVFPPSAHVTYEPAHAGTDRLYRSHPVVKNLRRKAHGITQGCYHNAAGHSG